MRQKHLRNVSCSFVLVGTPCCVRLPSNEMFHDGGGFSWCQEHKHRGQLLNWAQAHGYPAITFQGERRYAIGDPDHPEDNALSWKTTVAMGSEDMVWCAWSYVLELDSRGFEEAEEEQAS